MHGPGVPENSRTAFAAAIAAGHGIELDVRLSRDGFAVVFHNADLERLTDALGPLAARTRTELAGLRLGGTDDRIETLRDTLAFVAGRAPLLIEVKTDDLPHVAGRAALSVRHALEGYGGPAAVMSFDPRVPAWFAAHAPDFPRGLVVGGRAPFLKSLLGFRRARPHFLAHDVRSLPSSLASRARHRGLPILAWTVRSETQAHAQAHADQLIFER